MSITSILQLLSGIAFFLFGMNLMGSGLKKVAGNKLEVILYKLTSNSVKGILLGTGVTAVIQSSSATSVMVVGFVNSGMMKVKQAIAIIMGAIIGTSVTGWIICLSAINGSGVFEILSTDTLTALMAIIGTVLLVFTEREKNHHTAFILLGFSVLMTGISIMTEAVYPLRESDTFLRILMGFSNPVVGIMAGLVFTAIIQSASAAVGILQTIAVTGAVSFRLALPVVMGIAIGASVPVLLSALGANTNGKRTAMVYLLVDALGALIFGILFYSANAVFSFNFMDRAMSMADVALMNTLFRAMIVLLLTPLIGFLEKLVNTIIPDKSRSMSELRDVERLEERFIGHPALAIEQTEIAIRSMAGLSCQSIREALLLFESFSEEGVKRVCDLEEIIDTYEDRLGNYIVRIMKNELNEGQNKRVSLFLHSINDFERLGDHAKNLSESAREIYEKIIQFSPNAEKEMNTLFAIIREILQKTEKAFIENDQESSFQIAPLEEIIDNLCDEYKLHHIERVQNETCEYSHGFVFNDMLTDLERVGDHCSNLGVALRIQNGEMSDRHSYLTKQEIEKSHGYEEYYRKYSEIFQ